MFQAQNRETINSTWKVAVSFKIITTMSVTRSCFTKQHQTCKTETKTDFLVWDRSCPKTGGLRPHHCHTLTRSHSILTAICKPGLAGYPLNSPSPFIPELRILLRQAQTFLTQSYRVFLWHPLCLIVDHTRDTSITGRGVNAEWNVWIQRHLADLAFK